MSKEFMFNHEHVGKQVRHKDGSIGRMMSVGTNACWVDWGTTKTAYTIDGRFFRDSDVVVFLDEPTVASQPEYEETPFIPNRAEVWARFMAAAMSADWPSEAAANRADNALAEYEKRFLNQQLTSNG